MRLTNFNIGIKNRNIIFFVIFFFIKLNYLYICLNKYQLLMKMKEHKFQSSCIKFFRYKYPKLKMYLFAIPNGGRRDIITGRILKEEGVLPGIPDLFLAYPSNGYHGLFIELKQGKNKLTDNQAIQMELFSSVGYKCVVLYSIDDFISCIEEYLK